MTTLLSHPISPLAVDLTSAGAPLALQRERDPETEKFILARLAGLAKLLDRAGADLITIGDAFRVGGKRRREEFLDGARAVARLGQHTATAQLVASVPLAHLTPPVIGSTVAALQQATGGRAGWQIDASAPGRASDVATTVAALATFQAPTAVVVNVRTDVDVEIAAARADVARLQVATVEEARTFRAAIRAAARDWGREPDTVAVLIDAHVVLADSAADADARALFLHDLDVEANGGLLRHVGTAHTFATVWQNWVRAGAADGFTLLPASIPSDVVQIASALLPALEARGLRSTTATRIAAPARVRGRKHPVAV